MTMRYIENPKTKGSGIKCCIPQPGVCPVRCADCFFQSGRSYLEPLDQHLPNMPSPEEAAGFVISVNDGNDSNNNPRKVMAAVSQFPMRFYNTSMPSSLTRFDAPVILTINPGRCTDERFTPLKPIPANLMLARMRTNTWNLELVDEAVAFYTAKRVAVVLTFIAYDTLKIPADNKQDYTYRQRFGKNFWMITQKAWDQVMARYRNNRLVFACGRDANTFTCSECGNCLREYHATMGRLHSLPQTAQV